MDLVAQMVAVAPERGGGDGGRPHNVFQSGFSDLSKSDEKLLRGRGGGGGGDLVANCVA